MGEDPRPDAAVDALDTAPPPRDALPDGVGETPPMETAPPAATVVVTELSAAGRTVCALDALGAVWCWGLNDHGQCGASPSVAVFDRPRRVEAIPLARRVAVGGSHACAIARDASVWCWGDDTHGQCGDRGAAASTPPVRATELGPAMELSLGAGQSWALTTEGRARSVGLNRDCQLCNSLRGPVHREGALVEGLLATALHGGNRLQCASLAALDEVRCCGTIGSASATWCVPINPFGTLPRAMPWRVYAGGDFACMLSRGQELYCNGVNTLGQLGSPGGVEYGWRRVSVPGTVLLAAVGEAHGCALLTAGRGLFCWGRNDHGQLGRRENPDFTIPGAVLSNVRAFAPQQLALTAVSSCALQPDGGVYCWGGNAEGALGDGTRRDTREPVRALFPGP